MSLCSVIIINWNSWEQVEKQLALLTQDPSLDIVVVDNGSTETATVDEHLLARVRVVRLEKNRGYAYACNQGYLHARGEWVLFLNPDAILTAAAISQWINKAVRLHLDASSPVSKDPRYTKPLPSFYSLLVEFSPLRHIISLPARHLTLIGGALLIRSQTFAVVGGFDERFFLWFEDSDLTKRLLQEHVNVGRIEVDWSHAGGQSFARLQDEKRRMIFFHSLRVYARKHFSSPVQLMLDHLTRRFGYSALLLPQTGGVTLVVANMHRKLLDQFFATNQGLVEVVHELIIVTSGLQSSQVWEYRKHYPQVRFIVLEKNNGFASTVNIGLRVATTTVVGTQNDDVESDGSWIQQCQTLLRARVGSVNPVVYRMDASIESAGIQILKKGKALPLSDLGGTESVDATNGAAVLYSHAALERVGLFDERFGSYLEDIDLSMRLRRAGYKNVVCQAGRVTHHGQSTSRDLGWKKNWLDMKNWILVIIKNYTWKDILLYLPEIGVERLRNFTGILRALLS